MTSCFASSHLMRIEASLRLRLLIKLWSNLKRQSLPKISEHIAMPRLLRFKCHATLISITRREIAEKHRKTHRNFLRSVPSSAEANIDHEKTQNSRNAKIREIDPQGAVLKGLEQPSEVMMWSIVSCFDLQQEILLLPLSFDSSLHKFN